MLVHIIPDYSFLINFTVNKKHHRLNLQLNKKKKNLEDQLNIIYHQSGLFFKRSSVFCPGLTPLSIFLEV